MRMIVRAALPALMILFSAALLLAADLNGRWEGTLSTPNGDVSLTFNFKVDGAVLAGSVESAQGNFDISDGKVDGNKFTFTTHAGDSEITHEGTLSGDTIDLKVHGPWGDSDITLKRASEKPAAPQT
jgi:hypothetical protein